MTEATELGAGRDPELVEHGIDLDLPVLRPSTRGERLRRLVVWLLVVAAAGVITGLYVSVRLDRARVAALSAGVETQRREIARLGGAQVVPPASDIRATPTVPPSARGADGRPGEPGTSIVAVTIIADRLIVTYSDGTVGDAGLLPVVPPSPAATGPSGPPGPTGSPGPGGSDGGQGAVGSTGEAGRPPSAIRIDGQTCTPDTPPDPGSSPRYTCRPDPEPTPTVSPTPDATDTPAPSTAPVVPDLSGMLSGVLGSLVLLTSPAGLWRRADVRPVRGPAGPVVAGRG